MSKPLIGIVIHSDYSSKGIVPTEVNFIRNIINQNSDCEFRTIAIYGRGKELAENMVYDFKADIPDVSDFLDETERIEDFSMFDKYAALISHPTINNITGGIISIKAVHLYDIFSYMTVNLNRPVFIRQSDNCWKTVDYKSLLQNKTQNTKAESLERFYNIRQNRVRAHYLDNTPTWNYNKVYWLANGNKDICDWVVETNYDNLPDANKVFDRQSIINNTLYIGDDTFFFIKNSYEKYHDRYKDFSHNNKLFHIGAFMVGKKPKAFEKIFKDNKHSIPTKLFGTSTRLFEKINNLPNLDIEEGIVPGQSDAYFDMLHSHLAYINLGKGLDEIKYIGKTVYDAMVARIPTIVYTQCDKHKKTFSNEEYYFSDENQLKEIYDKLLEDSIRNKWINDQKEELFYSIDNKQPFKISSYL
jgi:hypothetical protein